MKLPGLLPILNPTARAPDIRVRATTPGVPGAWRAAIAAGDAVLLPAGTDEFQLVSDSAYPPGARLRIRVTGASGDAPDPEVCMEVRWRRRGEHPIFGRFTHGLTRLPPDRPPVPGPSPRDPGGLRPVPVMDDEAGNASCGPGAERISSEWPGPARPDRNPDPSGS